MRKPKLEDYCSTRKLGNTHLILTGRHLFVPKIGWIMDKHIEGFLSDCYEIVSLTIQDAAYHNYLVVMRSTESPR